MQHYNKLLRYMIAIFRKLRIVFLSAAVLISSTALANPQTARLTPVLDLSQANGKVIYLDFWASWCTPCLASFPYMNKLKAQYPESDFQIILINLDQNKIKAERFLKRVEEPVPSIYDPKGVIARHYKVSAMPTSIIIDRSGKIRYVHDGFHPDKTGEYTSHIEELIHEK